LLAGVIRWRRWLAHGNAIKQAQSRLRAYQAEFERQFPELTGQVGNLHDEYRIREVLARNEFRDSLVPAAAATSGRSAPGAARPE
jgi:hypothetical protein